MKEKIKNWLLLFLVLFLIQAITIYKTYYKGKEDAYEEIISEECWLDKQTRDIECTHYIAK